MKKFLSVILSVIILVSSVSVITAMATETEDYISFDADSSWELETAPKAMPGTIEAWINVSSDNTNTRLSVFGNYGRGTNYIPSVELRLKMVTNADTGVVSYAPVMDFINIRASINKSYHLNSAVINPGEWYHLSVARDSTAGKIYCYLNGVLVQTVNNAVFDDFVIEDTYAVGGKLSTPNDTYFNGKIASIAVYSDCRTAEENNADYTATVDTKNIAAAVNNNDTALVAAYDLKVSSGTQRIENAKTNGTALIENMWVEADEPDDYAYSFAVVGDTQKAAEYDVLNGTNYTDGIYDYIINNAEDKKIVHTFGLGDITDDSRDEEWSMIQNKTNSLPMSYSMVRGNHDTPLGFETYYGAGTHYAKQTEGHFGDNYLNTYHKFTAGGVEYLVVCLDYDPTDEAIAWANEVVAANKSSRVIVTTHAYLFRDGTTIGEGDGTYNNNNGEDIWNKLIRLNENIVLVIGGHDVSDRIMINQAVGDSGNTVTQLLINPQGMDEFLTKAGEAPAAMVAMLYFSKDGKTVDLRYYSTSRNTYFKSNNQIAFKMGYAIGSHPYLVDGGNKTPIIMEASKGEFYDDFIVPQKLVFDNFTTPNGIGTDKSFQLNTAKNNVITNSNGIEYLWSELSKPDENGVNLNAYGGIGKSVKVKTGRTNGNSYYNNTGAKEYYNSVRLNGTVDCTAYPNLEDIAIAFWVKTDGPVQFSGAFWDSYTARADKTTASEQKIYTDPVKISQAGEYIILLPLQSFYAVNQDYNVATDISSFKICNPEIMFKATGLATDEYRNIYIDNFGIYPIMPNFGRATHSAAAIIKDNMDTYANSETNVKEVKVSDTEGVWTTGNSYATSLRAVDRDDGKALCYTAKTYQYSAEGFASKNTFTATSTSYIVDFNDENGVNLKRNATLAIWVKASRASRVRVNTNSDNNSKWLYSDEIIIPAGESIIKVPMDKFFDEDLAFKRTEKLQLDFCCITPQANSIGGTAGTFMIDDIAIEPTKVDGDLNGDKLCNLLDLVRLKKIMAGAVKNYDLAAADLYVDSRLDSRDSVLIKKFLLGATDSPVLKAALINAASFVEKTPLIKNWQNKTKDTLTISEVANSPYYYSGSNDTTALKVTYSNLQADKGNNFYYNASLLAEYKEKSTFAFWVYSEQPVSLRYSYMDLSRTTSVSEQCKWKTLAIPAGESIVEIPMSEMVPDGHEMAYKSVYQLQFLIWSNNETNKSDGTIYFDSFGFYDNMMNFELLSGNEMFDGSNDTYWSPNTTETVVTGFKTESPVTFNAIDLTEYLDFDEDTTDYSNNSYVKSFVLDMKSGDRFAELCRLDEIGTRTVVLDEYYTGSEFRISATFTDANGGIKELAFKDLAATAVASDFRNVGYFCASGMDNLRSGFYDKIKGYTDIIMFDYGSWNENGEFLWGSMNDGIGEAHLAATLEEIRALDGGDDLDIWFCLQNYDKKTITDTSVLFATEESRNKLAQTALEICQKYNFVGIDIDYEYPQTPAEWRNYGEFLVTCGTLLHQNGYKFSAAMSSWGVNNITANIQDSLDYVNMMVYDIYDATGRHSPYSLARRFYNYFTGLGFRSQQLVLGLPYYSKTLELGDDGKHQFNGGGYRGLYDEYAGLFTSSTNIIRSKSGQWTYSYNGPDMLRDKVWYAMSNNMSGVFCWSLGSDIPTKNEKGVDSLGKTVIDAINRFSK